MATAQALMKRSKREVATYVKSECMQTGRTKSSLNELLDHLLDPQKNINDFGRLDWCEWLLAGGTTFDEFAKTVRSYDNATMCGLVWTNDFVAYRCRTCGITPSMSLCADCFLAGEHSGHDFNMFRSLSGGACDCGDVSVMKERGFCTRHGSGRPQVKSAPAELLAVPKAMMPRLLFRLILHMRSNCTPEMLDTYIIAMQNVENFLNLLHKLSDMGAAMRDIFTSVLTNPNIYTTLTQCTSDTSPYVRLSQDNYLSALGTLQSPSIPDEFKDLGLDRPLEHHTLLDELLFWMVKFEFPQKLVTLLLSILPNDCFKMAFSKAFFQHYTRITVALVNSVDRSRISQRVVHISVQLLSPEGLAVEMVRKHELMPIIMSSLAHMVKGVLTVSAIADGDAAGHSVVDCTDGVLRDHCYLPLMNDLTCTLSHTSIAKLFLDDLTFLRFWCDLLSHFQGMNINQRELYQHVEYEPESYYAAFGAELEMCSSPMWALLYHCKLPGDEVYVRNMINVVTETLVKWFSDINLKPLSTPKPTQISFHLPLHRYLSVFLSHAVRTFNMSLDDLLPAPQVLQMLMTHPLQLQVVMNEVFCGMWVRNGQQIRGQATTYIQSHFCNSMVDADLFLLQVCAGKLDSDYFVQTLLKRYHVLDLLTFVPRGTQQTTRGFLNPEHQMPLLEGALSLLAMIVSLRTHMGLFEEEVTRLEMVTLLCSADRTHSQIMNLMPEKCGIAEQTKNFEPTLRDVAEFKAPVFESDGNLQQGMYVPKDEIWVTDFDPLYVMLRAMYRRELQESLDRYTKHVKQKGLYKGSGIPWPPFRIPGPTLDAYKYVMSVLHCRTMHGLLFTLLYQAVKDDHLSDAVVYLVIYLLELVISVPDPKPSGIDIKIPDLRVDKNLDKWYSSRDIFVNLRSVIPSVTVSVVDSHAPATGTDHQLAPSPFPGTTSFITSATTPSASPNQTSLEPGSTALPAPANHTLSTLLQGASADIIGAVTAVLDLATTQVEAMSTENNPSGSNRSVTAMVTTQDVEIPVGESLLTLLIKLHDKLAGKPHSYTPPCLRPGVSLGAMDAGTESRIGDGVFFVGKLLDKICDKSGLCNKEVESIYRASFPDQNSAAGTSGMKRKDGNDREERNRRARERQQKLMAQFANKQKQFMEKNLGEVLSDEGEGIGDGFGSGDDSLSEVTYDCCICKQTTPSTHTRPLGLVALAQPSGVLGHRRHVEDSISLPVSDTCPALSLPNCSTEFDERIKLYMSVFDEVSCLMSVNLDWSSGVATHTCGHFVHLDCHASYFDSLKTTQQMSLLVSKGEFWCPLCRQLSNVVLPIMPQEHPSPVPPAGEIAHHVAHLLHSQVAEGSPPLIKAMGQTFLSLMSHSFKKFKTPTAANETAAICSVLRTNIELELLQQNGSPCLPPFSSLVSRKSCLLPLLHTLNSRNIRRRVYSQKIVDLWTHISGVTVDEQQSSSLMLYQQEVPVILKDCCTLLVQLLINLPLPLTQDVYKCLVQALYNVQCVQALVTMTCKFSDDERVAWQSHSHDASLQGLMGQVMQLLSNSGLYDDYTDADPHVPAICQSVWSPQSVEAAMAEQCLPFLRVAAFLLASLFDLKVPQIEAFDVRMEFSLLVKLLELGDGIGDGDDIGSTSCIRWLTEQPLISTWCQHFTHCVKRHTSNTRMMLTVNPVWHQPTLRALPQLYDKIFQYYRKRSCNTCNLQPKDPALCLLCAKLLCFRDNCCIHDNAGECVQHSIECGGGTGIVLVVNSSLVVVIRGKRATVWGSVYLDEHGEEDQNLKRGKPLYLSEERYRMLQQQWITHSFDRMCKRWILHHNRL